MKILYHHRIGSRDDGQLVHIEEMVAAFRQRGHEVIVVGPSIVEENKASNRRSDLISRLKKWLPRAVYECLEFGYSFGDYLRLSRAIRLHQPDLIYERYNLFFPSGIWARRRFNIPLILEANAPLYEERCRYGGIALKALARWSERYCWRAADRVVTVTGVLARRIAATGVAPGGIAITPNGIDFGLFPDDMDRNQAKRRLQLDGKLVLGFVGCAREWHGLERVLEVMSANRQWDLFFLLAGGGPALPGLRRLVAEKKLDDRVRFTGFMPHGEIASCVQAFDIALQPAVVDYASPLKLFEYMACRAAIVAPDKENIREVATHAHDALLFEPGDQEAFATAVKQLCEDRGMRTKLGIAARKTLVKKNATWEQNVKVVETLACSIMAFRQQERQTDAEQTPGSRDYNDIRSGRGRAG